jgi:hypothetical protein
MILQRAPEWRAGLAPATLVRYQNEILIGPARAGIRLSRDGWWRKSRNSPACWGRGPLFFCAGKRIKGWSLIDDETKERSGGGDHFGGREGKQRVTTSRAPDLSTLRPVLRERGWVRDPPVTPPPSLPTLSRSFAWDETKTKTLTTCSPISNAKMPFLLE